MMIEHLKSFLKNLNNDCLTLIKWEQLVLCIRVLQPSVQRSTLLH